MVLSSARQGCHHQQGGTKFNRTGLGRGATLPEPSNRLRTRKVIRRFYCSSPDARLWRRNGLYLITINDTVEVREIFSRFKIDEVELKHSMSPKEGVRSRVRPEFLICIKSGGNNH